MTYKLLFLAAVLSLQQLSAQQLLFPKQNYKDSIALYNTRDATWGDINMRNSSFSLDLFWTLFNNRRLAEDW